MGSLKQTHIQCVYIYMCVYVHISTNAQSKLCW